MKALVWVLALAGVLAVGWVLSFRPWRPYTCWDCVLLRNHRRCVAPPSRTDWLKMLASAQADYRANDRDGDGRPEFWRGDVAGLAFLVPRGGGPPIQLIEPTVAAADARPLQSVLPSTQRRPKNGYWYKAIRHADEDPARLSPDRFAFCAYPDDPNENRKMFIIDEDNTIYAAPAVKGGVNVFPDEAMLREKWSKFD